METGTHSIWVSEQIQELGHEVIVANPRKLVPENVPGEFFVDTTCIDCDTCRQIDPATFGHGRTRNLLMREARGAHVALLTQDAEPVDGRWLERLLEGFSLAEDVAIVYGPYRPRPNVAFAVHVETAATHITMNPVAVNMQCHSARRARATFTHAGVTYGF